jgi:hypothetical protein
MYYILPVQGQTKMHTELGWRNLKEEDHLEDLRVDVRIKLKLSTKRDDERELYSSVSGQRQPATHS